MTTATLAQITFAHTDGLPRDNVTNSLVFNGPSPMVSADFDTLASIIDDFYTLADGTTGQTISWFINEAVSRTVPATIRFYDLTGHLDGTPHGSPIATRTFTVGGFSGTTHLPAEMAVAASFHGALAGLLEESGATRPRARHRGRIYIGPLTTAALTPEGTSNRAKVSDLCRNTITNLMAQLKADAETAGMPWHVWSRKNATIYPVVGGFVDDAFDVQRRRGERALARSTWGS